VSAATVIQVPVALVFSLLAARKPRQTWLIVFGTVMTAGGLVGILFAPTTGVVVWVLLIGIGQGVAFSVALILLVVRTADSHDTSHLSAIAQTVGYVVAAVGMSVVGAVHDAVGTWGPVLVLLLIFLVPQLIAGLVASRDVIIGQ
jgi:CP family cyanate transporter-like MFS transporter